MATNIPTPNERFVYPATSNLLRVVPELQNGMSVYSWFQSSNLAIGVSNDGLGLYSLAPDTPTEGNTVAATLLTRIFCRGSKEWTSGFPGGKIHDTARGAYLELCLGAADHAADEGEAEAIRKFAAGERVRCERADELCGHENSDVNILGECWNRISIEAGPIVIDIGRLLFQYFDQTLPSSHVVRNGHSFTGERIFFHIKDAGNANIGQERNGWNAIGPGEPGTPNSTQHATYELAAAAVFSRFRDILNARLSGHERMAWLPAYDRIAVELADRAMPDRRFPARL